MFELLKFPFVQNALIGGEIVAIIAGMLGPLLIFRKMSFISVGISHGTFAGIALGIFLGISPLWMAVAFAIGLGIFIGFVSRTGKISEDATIGTLFAFSMALGIWLISLNKGYHPDVMGYLFGDLLAISRKDMYFAVIILGITMFWYLIRGKAVIYSSFDEDFSKIVGVPVEVDYYIFMAIAALVTVAAVRFVGVVLTSSIMIAPGVSAKMLSKRFSIITLLSVLFGMISIFIGIFISFELNISSGPSVVFVATTIFFISLILKWVRNRKVKTSLPRK
ncbi:metal ABC transporter permease [Mesoaciditoga lauensis]|uniref:metal ABC transporter permease n=1 Tax=Mesoaciditoga lauensis TaxID=1495039 RepID=UPI00056AE40C|nr:metal ABC transporter permease [Mesoaciditoga lauensis]